MTDEVEGQLTLALSAALYAVTWQYDWNMTAYPNGSGPLIPSLGNCCSCSAPGARSAAPDGWRGFFDHRSRCGSAFAYLVLAFCVTLTWHFPQLELS